MAEVIGGGAAAKVKTIFVYPIKSCRGISVSQAPIISTGFRWDRQWLVVNSKGRACTQRVEPKLALVEVTLPTEAFSEGWEPNNNSYLVIRAPGMSPLKIPLSNPSEVTDGVSVWEWSGSALDEGAEAAMWFSTHLGKPCRLVRFSEVKEMRVVDPNYAQGYKVMFSDGYPYLVLSQGSLNALNSLLKEPVPVNRFRPNVLVDGCEPFAEDLWKEIRINNLTFEGVKLCSRCKFMQHGTGEKLNIFEGMLSGTEAEAELWVRPNPTTFAQTVPTINQETAVAGSEPTETLTKFRSDKALRPSKKQQGKVYFGQNMVCSDALSRGKRKIIKVGDPVYVLKVVPSSAEAPA